MKILYVLNDTLHHAGTESVILNYYNHIDRDNIHIKYFHNMSIYCFVMVSRL